MFVDGANQFTRGEGCRLSVCQDGYQTRVDVVILPPDFGFGQQPQFGDGIQVFGGGGAGDVQTCRDVLNLGIGRVEEAIQEVVAVSGL